MAGFVGNVVFRAGPPKHATPSMCNVARSVPSNKNPIRRVRGVAPAGNQASPAADPPADAPASESVTGRDDEKKPEGAGE